MEENYEVFPVSEYTPPGIDLVDDNRIQGATGNSGPPPFYGPDVSCSDANAMRVGIVDFGLDIGNPELSFCGVSDTNGSPLPGKTTKCMGASFVQEYGQNWYNPPADRRNSHATHIAG